MSVRRAPQVPSPPPCARRGPCAKRPSDPFRTFLSAPAFRSPTRTNSPSTQALAFDKRYYTKSWASPLTTGYDVIVFDPVRTRLHTWVWL